MRRVAAALLSVLVGCGGGGGNGSPPEIQPPPPAATGPCASGGSTAVVVSANAVVGQQAAAGILGCSVKLTRVQWTQTRGPAVSLLSSQTQLIHFEPSTAGDYGFRVDSEDEAGTARTAEVSVSVTAPAQPARALLRNHQAVRMGGKVSMRAWSPTGEDISAVSWTQLEGPTVTLNEVDSSAKQFVAPVVAQDSLLRFRATITTPSGTDSQELLVVVENFAQAPAGNNSYVWSGSHVSRVHAYLPASPYAKVLTPCVYDPQLTSSTACSLSRLPLLGQETAGALPSVEQVMARVLVSHDWLGANFEAFLRSHDARGDFRRMLMSTTAIVLGAHVRPSFYHPASGAIYLDAANFWLSPEQRDTIDEAPDYRSGYGNALAYAGLWRYAKDNQRFITAFDVRKRQSRSQADLLATAGWLLYHELSHAGDFIPAAQLATLSPSTTVTAVTADRFSRRQLTSDLMTSAYPLSSSALTALAQVNFAGKDATEAQKAFSADQVGASFFAPDLATDPYAYFTSREDLAVLVEEALVSLRLGAQRDVAFVPRNADGPDTSQVRWGQRGRAGDARLRERLRLAAASVAPWLDGAALAGLPAPLPMRVGESWTANLQLGPTASLVRRAPLSASAQAAAWAAEELAQRHWQAEARERQAGHEQVERWLRR